MSRERDENGMFIKKGLYLTETCKKCPVENCEGVIASKGSVVLYCPKKNKFKKGKKRE